jgi:hypothetical protein
MCIIYIYIIIIMIIIINNNNNHESCMMRLGFDLSWFFFDGAMSTPELPWYAPGVQQLDSHRRLKGLKGLKWLKGLERPWVVSQEMLIIIESCVERQWVHVYIQLYTYINVYDMISFSFRHIMILTLSYKYLQIISSYWLKKCIKEMSKGAGAPVRPGKDPSWWRQRPEGLQPSGDTSNPFQ